MVVRGAGKAVGRKSREYTADDLPGMSSPVIAGYPGAERREAVTQIVNPGFEGRSLLDQERVNGVKGDDFRLDGGQTAAEALDLLCRLTRPSALC